MTDSQAPTELSDYTGRDELAQLDETIAYYAQNPDEASQQEARRLRRIRDRSSVVTVACPNAA